MNKAINNRWRKILSNFELEGTPVEISRLGKGLINDTFRLGLWSLICLIMVQRINSDVFKDVDKMQHNMTVTAHIRDKCLIVVFPEAPIGCCFCQIQFRQILL